MATAYLGLGTNVGNKRGNLVTASALLAERVGDVLALSDMYETEPWGFESENTFLNAVIVLMTEFSPIELLDATRQIEIEMGRIKKSDGSYHDRIIDIDLLMVDEQIIHTERLILPHPLMHKRLFVMEPLVEVAPLVKHPVLGKTMSELLSEL
ncbi:2-amino-4-hydroxy-6-hydroxymethyldihydropteridine diphosphokinase [uncultured Parabacteroides sp.]|uniref:2-amino-4-hydroxy-6- hydroxymethyldihydropteridine diphosphokinase n=1 Tax=uncultured Parabacteroides sp. TaxID=512312 RepID=UPI002614F981|nr:2-amino-4-hydroxy-6-hydroxymethyldihydropteridine diphosphokinase [uncultured Parabacteroides sp.]